MKQLAGRVDVETKPLREEMGLAKQVAAAVYCGAAGVHSALVEQIAAGAEKTKSMFHRLAEAAEKESDLFPGNIDEAVKRLESTILQASRMRCQVERTAKDLRKVVRWKFASDLPLAATRAEGVTSCRVCQQAQVVADRAWYVIRGELIQQGLVTDAATTSVDVLAVEAFQNEAIYQGWLANECVSFVETYFDADPSQVSNLREQVKVSFDLAKQSAHKVENHSRKAVEEERQAKLKATVPGVVQHLRKARNAQEMTSLESMEASKSSLTYAAWKRLSMSASEAVSEPAQIAKVIAANTGAVSVHVREEALHLQSNATLRWMAFERLKV
ncbi:hypothetical protein Esti_005932 [Eimeria stiedai]